MDSSISFHHLLSENHIESILAISKLPKERFRDVSGIVDDLKRNPTLMKTIKNPTENFIILSNRLTLALFSTGNLLDNCTNTPFEIKLNGKKLTIKGSEAFYQAFKFPIGERSDFIILDPKESASRGRQKQVTKSFGGNFFEDHWNPKMRFIAMLVALHFKLTAHPKIKEILISMLGGNTLPCEVQNFKNEWTISEKNYLCGCLATIGLLFIQNPNLDVHSLVPEEYRKHFALDKYVLLENELLVTAASEGLIHKVELLLGSECIDVDGLNDALLLAAKFGHVEIVKLLLTDPRIDRLEYAIATVIIYSPRLGGEVSVEILDILLKDPRSGPNHDLGFAIQYASEIGDLPIVNRLLQDPRTNPVTYSNKAIIKACCNGHIDVVKRLLENPIVDPEYDDFQALKEAHRNGYYDIVNAILDARPNINSATLPREIYWTKAFRREAEARRENYRTTNFPFELKLEIASKDEEVWFRMWIYDEDFRRKSNTEPTRKKFVELFSVVRYHLRKTWMLFGKNHRENDLPAVICVDGSQEWWVNGRKHRENDLPAVISDVSQEWWVNGKQHREDNKPAVIANGYQEWVNGKKRKALSVCYDERVGWVRVTELNEFLGNDCIVKQLNPDEVQINTHAKSKSDSAKNITK